MTYYHVRVSPKSDPAQNEFEFDLSEQELMDRFVHPYSKGLPLVVAGASMRPEEIGRIRINRTSETSAEINKSLREEARAQRRFMPIDHRGRLPLGVLADQGDELTSEYITGPPGYLAPTSNEATQEIKPSEGTREVFVVHGRNAAARDAMFQFLQSLDLHPLEWSEAVQRTGKASPYIGEILDAAFGYAHAVVVLLTPDDEARLKPQFAHPNDPSHETQLTGQARPNVLFEAGMAMARSQDRTVLVELGNLRPFSDLAGRHAIRLDNSSQRRQELAQRLELAGCPVNRDGTAWHGAGDFDAALSLIQRPLSESSGHLDAAIDTRAESTLSNEAKEFLLEATKGGQRPIMRLKHHTGTMIYIGSKSFGRSADRRSQIQWEHALNSLIDGGLLEWQMNNGTGDLFVVTAKGFEEADRLNG